MIKMIIFDLDGVLVDAKELHYEALNKALGERYSISWEEHLNIYDGLKTSQKLDMLTDRKGLPKEAHAAIWTEKQRITMEGLKGLKKSERIAEAVGRLSSEGYMIGCCSNSIRKTVLTVLSRLGIIEFFDIIITNEDVTNSKPHPEMYWSAMSKMSILPEETLIIEDSPAGLMAAHRSRSNIFRVDSSIDVTYENINNRISDMEKRKEYSSPRWTDKKMNVLIPMAGAGSRFEKAGYTFPKPLIEVGGMPMIQLVTDNINIDANYIYVVQKAHREKYNLDALLGLITPGCRIVETVGVTEGAACTALLAKELIDSDMPLFFANSDQFVEWDSNEFMYKMQESECDGGIVTFNATHPKWSFAKVDESGLVSEVAEKNPISDKATVGFYYWRKGSDFVRYAEQMIEEDARVNGEFYVCPVFNWAIRDSKKIKTYDAKEMWGLGTPEDLASYIERKR